MWWLSSGGVVWPLAMWLSGAEVCHIPATRHRGALAYSRVVDWLWSGRTLYSSLPRCVMGDHKVYLGNLSDDCRERDLEKFLKGYGTVRNISVKVSDVRNTSGVFPT